MRNSALNLTEQVAVLRWSQWALSVMQDRPHDTSLLRVVASEAPAAVRDELQRAKDNAAKLMATYKRTSDVAILQQPVQVQVEADGDMVWA